MHVGGGGDCGGARFGAEAGESADVVTGDGVTHSRFRHCASRARLNGCEG
jgi:hypothetical protein